MDWSQIGWADFNRTFLPAAREVLRGANPYKDECGGLHFSTFHLGPGGEVRLHTGCVKNTATDIYWCKEGHAVWNNDGDTVFLFERVEAWSANTLTD
ncbi:MAG TPA: hypothetical protein DCP08_04980 [Chloroflexi bacterium]|nr:hypothetical protein [Chloroflexota bacterium]